MLLKSNERRIINITVNIIWRKTAAVGVLKIPKEYFSLNLKRITKSICIKEIITKTQA